MGDLTPVWRIHAVLAGADALRPTDPAGKAGIALPHGVGTSRWLSAGASSATGWPLRVENILNEILPRHVVLNLARTDLPDVALVDELHPQFPEGFQRLARVAEDVRGRLSDMGLRAQLGGLAVFPSTTLPPAALRKIVLVARRIGFDPLVAGLDPTGLPATPPRTPSEAEAVARRVAGFFRGSDAVQPSAARIERANAGNSGSRAPIE